MKRLIRAFIVNAFALWLVSSKIAIGGIIFGEGTPTLLLAALALAIVNFIVRPLINLLLLPLNLVTLGTMRWVANVVTLFIVTLIVPGFALHAFNFPGFSYQGFIFPALSFGTISAFIVISFLISLISSFLFWLSH